MPLLPFGGNLWVSKVYYHFFKKAYGILTLIIDQDSSLIGIGVGSPDQVLPELFPNHSITFHPDYVSKVFHSLEQGKEAPISLKGTPFQQMVWKNLKLIPKGHVLSYSAFAQRLNLPHHTRAIASAIARNPVSILYPCHRVIRHSGHLGNYRWGNAMKKEILDYEYSTSSQALTSLL